MPLGIILLVIGRGPSSPTKLTAGIMIAVGILFAVLSLAPGTRVGRGSKVPISNVGRVILFVVAIISVATGLRAFLP